MPAAGIYDVVIDKIRTEGLHVIPGGSHSLVLDIEVAIRVPISARGACRPIFHGERGFFFQSIKSPPASTITFLKTIPLEHSHAFAHGDALAFR